MVELQSPEQVSFKLVPLSYSLSGGYSLVLVIGFLPLSHWQRIVLFTGVAWIIFGICMFVWLGRFAVWPGQPSEIMGPFTQIYAWAPRA